MGPLLRTMGNIVVGLEAPYLDDAVILEDGHGTKKESRKAKEWVTKPQNLLNAQYSAKQAFLD